MKKTGICAILLAFTILLGMTVMPSGFVSAADPIKVAVNGKTVEFPDVQPFTDANGRIFVPVRFVSEELGCEVEWHLSTSTVTISRGRINAELVIGEKEITVLGVKKTMDTAAQILDGRTLVPARFIAEAFGCEVSWNGSTRTSTITDPGTDVYKIGGFAIGIEPDDALSRITTGLVVTKKSGLIVVEGDNGGKPVLNIRTIIDVVGADVPKQLQEIEAILKHCLSDKVAEEVIAHVSNIKTYLDKVELKQWYEGRYHVLASGSRAVISIMVYMD